MANIIQWNLDGFYKRSTDIQRILFELQPSVLCLQETNLKMGQTAHLKNYISFCRNRENPLRASGGVAILIRNNIENHQVNLQTHLEAIAVSIKLQIQICICNIYLPDSTNFSFHDLIHITSQLPKPFILCGDFNSRNTLWGSSYTDSRGKIVEKMLEEPSLILLNNGSPTRHNAANGNLSAIDLSIASTSIAPRIEWNTLPAYNGSDHWPIQLQLFHQPSESYPINKWKLKSPNWDLFSCLVDQYITENQLDLLNEHTPIINQTYIDELINKLSKLIIKAANIAIGKSNRHLNKRTVPWWNDDCRTAITNYKKALNRFKKTKLETDHILLKKYKAESRYITKKSKIECWQKYTSTINIRTHPSAVWNKIRALKGCKHQLLPNHMHYNHTELNSAPEIAQAFAESFQTNSSNTNYEDDFLKFKNETENNFTINLNPQPDTAKYNHPFNLKELLFTLQNCNSKSPGPDDIPFTFLKHLSENAINTLLTIYNLIWNNGIFPNQWRHAFVIPIPKPGKDKFNILSYRPISLISTLSKVLEKMINKRLVWFLETNKKFTIQQCGFRKNHSTQDILATLHTDITEAIIRKQHLILIALDIEKAYDMVWKKNVLSSLQKWNITGNMLNFLHNFLLDRKIQVKLGNILSTHLDIENGLPQGSSISVTLFLVTINDIFNSIQSPIKSTLFADDCNIYCKGENIKTTVALLQTALKSLSQWSSVTGLKFSPTKTQGIIFNYKNKNDTLHHLYLNNSKIEYTERIRILGMIFDSKLSWVPHLKNLKTECKNRMKIIKTLSHNTWGSETHSLLTIYKSLILSKIDYGSLIYYSANSNILRIIDPIHNEGIRLSIGAFRTSPVPSILCIAGEPPLQIRRNKEVLKYAAKKKNLEHHMASQIFTPSPSPKTLMNREKIMDTYIKLCSNSNCLINTDAFSPFTTTPFWQWSPKINTQLLHFKKNSTSHTTITAIFNEILHTKFHDFKHIYTDASKTNVGVGFAYCSSRTSKCFKLLPEASIFTAETQAIKEALLSTNSTSTNNILIISDSLSALLAIEAPNPSNEIIYQIHNIISSTQKVIEFMWVPSHTGIPGNEKADTLAKEAISSISSSSITTLPYQDIKRTINAHTTNMWQTSWDEIPMSNKLKSIKKKVTKWHPQNNIPRRSEIINTRTRIGHTNLTHIHIIKREEHPLCSQCNVPLSIKHIVLDCPLHVNARDILNQPSSMEEALGEHNTHSIHSFFKAIGIDTKI